MICNSLAITSFPLPRYVFQFSFKNIINIMLQYAKFFMIGIRYNNNVIRWNFLTSCNVSCNI
jgi:hypothetical protein